MRSKEVCNEKARNENDKLSHPVFWGNLNNSELVFFLQQSKFVTLKQDLHMKIYYAYPKIGIYAENITSCLTLLLSILYLKEYSITYILRMQDIFSAKKGSLLFC